LAPSVRARINPSLTGARINRTIDGSWSMYLP
jgi:hypothetical protein